MGNPKTGVMFHLGDGMPMDFDKLFQRVIRPVVEAIGIDWYGWHGFRRGTLKQSAAIVQQTQRAC